jgi:FixJ family two-component response regulator
VLGDREVRLDGAVVDRCLNKAVAKRHTLSYSTVEDCRTHLSETEEYHKGKEALSVEINVAKEPSETRSSR